MKRTLLALFALCAVFAGTASAEEEMHHRVLPTDSVKWIPSTRFKGAQIAILYGDARKEGHYIFLAKLPDGLEIPPHWHTNPENVVILSGVFNVGMGDKLDKSKGQALGPGGFFSSGSVKMHHYAWATGETVMMVTGMGSLDLNYVDPKDDPRTEAKN
jgi:hypothetical protein